MKKIIGFLIVFGVLVLGAPQAKAYTLDDLMAQITSLQQQVSGLQSQMSATALKAVTLTPVPISIYPAGCNSYMGFSSTTGLPCFLQTNPATSITSTTAILNGKLFASAPATISWNINPSSFGISSYITSTNGPLTANLAGLTPNTTYQFQVCSQNTAGGPYCAGWLSFTTKTTTTVPISVTPVKAVDTNLPCASTAPASIKVTYPNGGETWTAGNQKTITWKSCNILATDSVSIWAGRVNTINGTTFDSWTLSSSTLNDGSQIFTLPSNLVSGQYELVVKRNSSIYDRSDNLFTINAGNIVSPTVKSTTTPTTVTPTTTTVTTATKLTVDKAAKNVFRSICRFQHVAGFFKTDNSIGCGSAFGPLTTMLLKKYYRSFVLPINPLTQVGTSTGVNPVTLSEDDCLELLHNGNGSDCIQIGTSDVWVLI